MADHVHSLLRALMLLAAIASPIAAQAQAIPAFPGAEGYGGYAKGGRGGDVYIVTNLNASGAGSFANGIATVPASGRTIVFAVSGYIPMSGGGLRLTASNVTIAGQTAPGGGVGLRNSAFRISGDDVVVRHLRFRHGRNGTGGDCVNLDSGSINTILDHISMQFSTDENMSSFSSPPENLTLQWSLNAWGLEPHAMGGLWDQNHATCHHSLWAHNRSRDPKSRPNGLLEWINNVTFDYGIGFIMGDSQTPASWRANVRNCYFICPPGNIRGYALSRASLDRNGNPNFTIYLDNCRWDRDGDTILDGVNAGYSMAIGDYAISPTPFANTGAIPVTMDDPLVAHKKIVSNAGALRLDVSDPAPLRDEVDARLMQDLVSFTGRHIAAETDLVGISAAGFGTLTPAAAPTDTDKDGMPDFYETALGWNPAVQDHNTPLPSAGGVVTGTTFLPANTPAGAGPLEQYTRLEEYLHYLAIPHGTVPRAVTGSPTSLVVDLAKFTSGFSSGASFSVANVVGGSVALSGPGNSTATFSPTLNYAGRARFDFTVTDSAGHSWTQTCAIVVTTSALPRDLTWKGTSATWDSAALAWIRPSSGATVAFATGDRVSFDTLGVTQPSITVSGAQVPGSVEVNASASYSFTGAGAITSTGELLKRGTGTLTLGNTGPNAFASATLEAGTISMGNGGALGTGPLRIESGTLQIGTSTPSVSMITVAGPAIITGGSGGGTAGIGAAQGSAPLTIQQTNIFDLGGDLSGYSGTLRLAGNAMVRLNGSSGSALATFDLGTGAATLAKRSSASTVTLGALRGGTGTTLAGATGGGNATATTYVVGGTGDSSVFAGTIANGQGTTSLTKVGAGTLTLTGAATHTGTTAVNLGGLAVEGTVAASLVTVANGARLSGSGSLGPVTIASGGILEPGADAGSAAGTLAVGALTLNSPTLGFDLSNTPAGANDRVQASSIALNGLQTFDFRLKQGPLSPGTYVLLQSTGALTASGSALASNLTNTPRQTFSLQRTVSGVAPGRVELVVTGSIATLTWTGAVSSIWDTATSNWTGATPNTFAPLDAVVFDDSASARIISLAAALDARSTTVDTVSTYRFDGPGGLSGAGTLTKSGQGTLTLSAANSHTGGTSIEAGTVALASDTANASALGSGPVTLAGGTLAMFNNSSTYNSMDVALVVPAGKTGRLNADSRCDIYGSLEGSGTFDFYVPWVRTSLFADWSAFDGTINVLSDADGGDFRISRNYDPAGYPQALIVLGPHCSLYFSGILDTGAGTVVEIGALQGPSTAHLLGGPTSDRALTYRIGGKNLDTTFSGDFTEQGANTLTALVKSGTGIWTLAGPCTHRGATRVEGGTLRIALTGSITNTAPLTVAAGATLSLQGGSITVDGVTVETGGSFQVTGGSLAGELNNRGTVTVSSGTFSVTGDIVNSGTIRVTGLAALQAAGTIVNDGVLDLLTSSGSVPDNLSGNGVVILNTDRRILSWSKSGANFSATVQGYPGHTYQLQRATTPGGTWTNAGAAQSGTGVTITLTDAGGATGTARFYRVLVQP